MREILPQKRVAGGHCITTLKLRTGEVITVETSGDGMVMARVLRNRRKRTEAKTVEAIKAKMRAEWAGTRR
jgi:hypothetical protein